MMTKKKKSMVLVGIACVGALLCAALLSGCALASAHAASVENAVVSGTVQEAALEKVDGVAQSAFQVGIQNESQKGSGYVDANNDGVCDNCDGTCKNHDGTCSNGGAYCDGTRHNGSAGAGKNGQGDGLQDGNGFQNRAQHGNGHK